MDSNHLLVPIKVQALVIDDLVIKRRGAIQKGDKYAANAGRWSPLTYDYQQVPRKLIPPGPMPFYGAGHQYSGSATEQLVLPKDSPALPKDEHRGVYLHWILPSGLRHAYTPGQLDFPALPDHWLIVRFSHQAAAVKTRAWFVDGGAVVSEGQGNLLFEGATNEYTAKTVGKVTPLEQFATTDFSREPQEITAVGNATTGSPTFTAFIAENRNIFSWHDKLEDLRQPNATGSVPDETTLTYLVLGWYRTPAHEPLAAPVATVTAQYKDNELLGWLIDPPGWFVDAKSGQVELLKRRSVFHGMVAHVNYWANTYKGQMLGYPGAPSVEGVMRPTPPSFTIGVGNNAEDALVSLVSSSYSAESAGSVLAEKQPNLWKALEAVIYRQTESLVKNWNIASRDVTVHQNWFDTRDAGKIWYFRAKSGNQTEFSQNAEQTARETKVRPTADQLTRLNELNGVQSEADAFSREISALQTDLYARWWKLCAKSRNRFTDRPTAADEADLEDLSQQIATLRGRLAERVTKLPSLAETLRTSLPRELELKSDAAPRFWVPADPVVVVKDCGRATKHQFPRQHPCRLPEQIVTNGEVVVTREDQTKETNKFDTASGVSDIGAAARKYLPACPEVVPALLNEGSIVEQAIHDLAARTLPATKLFEDEPKWRTWTQRLNHDLTWDGNLQKFPLDVVKFGKPNALNIRPDRLAELWTEQPWAPLFLDWEITWFPTTSSSTSEHSFGPAWVAGQADFAPLNAASIPTKGYTIRGRSLLSPIDERIFKEPINALRDLLREDSEGDNSFSRADAREVRQRDDIVWDKTLKELSGAGLMGQALSGFHQSLLRRDVVRPRFTPDPKRPWIADRVAVEEKVCEALKPPNHAGVAGEPLVPPATKTIANEETFFSLIRAGALRIDELWLIDDFGQTADLLGKTAGSQVFHPRMRWHNDESVVAMPPRVLQPVRLNFRFTPDAEEKIKRECDPSLDPICGWLFFNPLDRALVLCDRCGELMGHLVISKNDSGRRVKWNGGEPGAGGVAIEKITNPSLKRFATSFIQTTPVSNPKLVELLNLIDSSLARIRPAAARNNAILVGRPLALVNATIGLELFGKAWTDPHKGFVKRDSPGSALDTLRVRVNLGDLHNVEDGLIGYFKESAFDRIVVPQFPDKVTASDYLGDPKKHAVQVGFGSPQQITLLMDPWGSVQAACGIVPAKTISLADAELDETVMQMETSFRVGPVLVQADRIALPTPTGDKGVWNFSGPLTNQTAAAVAALDPRHFSDQPVVATEGRLLLLNEE